MKIQIKQQQQQQQRIIERQLNGFVEWEGPDTEGKKNNYNNSMDIEQRQIKNAIINNFKNLIVPTKH